MSALIPAAAAAAPLAGWSLHAWWMRRNLNRARRDPLTGLHTRAMFERRAARILARHEAGVVVIDLNGFKALNDTHGHAAGDAAIAAVGARLAARAGWFTARLGGDEFAALVPDPRGLRRRLDLLHLHLSEPFEYEGRSLVVGASIGAVATGPGADLTTALRRADEAMYAAKTSRVPFFLAPALDVPLCRTVNGRRAGRGGTHHTEGRAA